MTEERIQQIEAVIARCEAQGIAWTNLVVYEQVGGRYQTLSQYLKRRRALQRGAPIGAVEEDPATSTEDSPQDAPDARQEAEANGGSVDPVPAPPPAPDVPDEPAVPVEAPPLPRPLTPLEALQQAAREADALLVRLTRERDLQQTVAQGAALALHQARRDAQRLARALRATVQQARTTPAPYQCEAQARVQQLHTQLSALVGETDAERIAHDHHYAPAWLWG